MINRICEKALMYAFQNQKRLIDDYMIKYVVEHEMLGTMIRLPNKIRCDPTI